jgi:hypothetical protein
VFAGALTLGAPLDEVRAAMMADANADDSATE